MEKAHTQHLTITRTKNEYSKWLKAEVARLVAINPDAVIEWKPQGTAIVCLPQGNRVDRCYLLRDDQGQQETETWDEVA